jgi:transposase, IS5 family
VQGLIGNILDRCITDAGYRSHNARPDHRFKIYQADKPPRRAADQSRIKRQAAIEPITPREHPCMGRSLAQASVNIPNAALAAAG